jgi:hypothetical protein
MTAPTDTLARVAFAGPRAGMSDTQTRAVGRVLTRWYDEGATELHHQGDLTGLQLVDHAARHYLDLFVVAHPAAGQTRPMERAGVNDEVAIPLPADGRDEHLAALCGRVLVAVGGPAFWERAPVWRLAARAHDLGRVVAVVDLWGQELHDVSWPAPKTTSKAAARAAGTTET